MRRRNKTITIRCTEDEYRLIHDRTNRYGLPLSDFVLRSALGKRIVIADGLKDVMREQKAIGRNLNQIAMLAHEGRLRSVRLDKLIEQHTAATKALCEIARAVR